MVFASTESTAEAGHLRSAITSDSDLASSRMFDEVRNYQVADQVNSHTKCIGQSDGVEGGKCLSLSQKEISKMMSDFSIAEPLSQKPRPIDPGHNPGAASGKPDKCSDKPGVLDVKPGLNPDKYPDKKPDKPGSKPWQSELGVCAPGSPYKIDCFDDKDRDRKVK
jgi:hypothetical protein